MRSVIFFILASLVFQGCSLFHSIEPPWGDPFRLAYDTGGGDAPTPVAAGSPDSVMAVWIGRAGMSDGVWAKRWGADEGWGVSTRIDLGSGYPCSGYLFDPQIVMDAGGNAVAVWCQWDGRGYHIWANRYAAGTGWEMAVAIANEPLDGLGPRVGIDSKGNAIAVWSQSDEQGYRIYSNRHTPGVGWGMAGPIHQNTGYASVPQLAVDPTGNAVAVWVQADENGETLYASRYMAGVRWEEAAPIGGPSEKVFSPQVAVNPGGEAAVVWFQGSKSETQIWTNRHEPGRGWGTAVRIDPDQGAARYPRVVIDEAGNVIAVWYARKGGLPSVWVSRYQAGNGWNPATQLARKASDPQVVIDRAGRVIAVWDEWEWGAVNLYASWYQAGVGWGKKTRIENLPGDSFHPQVAVDPHQNLVVTWEQFDGKTRSIWANRSSSLEGSSKRPE